MPESKGFPSTFYPLGINFIKRDSYVKETDNVENDVINLKTLHYRLEDPFVAAFYARFVCDKRTLRYSFFGDSMGELKIFFITLPLHVDQ